MAEAMTEMIPCDSCHTQVSFDDWTSHAKNCTNNAHNRVEAINQLPSSSTTVAHRNLTQETNSDGIPCELCDALIELSNWEIHTKQCADSRNSRINEVNNGMTDDTMTTLIPCEYCNVPISLHELEWHSRQCAKTERERIENLARQLANGTSDDLIPCQYCEQPFSVEIIETHQTECQCQQTASLFPPNTSYDQILGGATSSFPPNWNFSMPQNLSRFIITPDSDEYKMVAETFHQSLKTNTIIQIERIQNRRWYRQYDAHKDDFIERYGKSTEQWLFHGCKSQSIDAIVNDCFNRSHATRCAAGQGIYFATQAATSFSYTQPDANNIRHMFMARVLVGKTTAGNTSTRVCPPGFDTTGGGTVFVTYHDAQAYGEYLIAFR